MTITQRLPNDHFTNVIIRKVIKIKFASNCRAYIRIKNKTIKMQHNIYTYSLKNGLVTARLVEKDKIRLFSNCCKLK